MLTGQVAPSSGDAWFYGESKRVLIPSTSLEIAEGECQEHRIYRSIVGDLASCRQLMGYCPQFDGLQPNMTVSEHLHFYARTRGVPPSARNNLVWSA